MVLVTGGLSKVYALDFDPQGVLYGLGVRTSDSAIVYFSLDCVTAAATILGDTGLTHTFSVTDMDFDSIGRLFAYVNDGDPSPPGDQLGIIDHVLGQIHVGQYIELGNTGLDDELGNAIASNPFPSDPLYHAGDASGITILSKATGAASAMLAAITFPASVTALSPFITSMDNDPFNNVVYVSFQDSAGDHYIATINLSTGVVTFLSDNEQKAPPLLNAITVNRRYEECDFRSDNTPPLPVGTSCTHECLVIEHDCSDGIDNDQNGLTDCMDPACNDQPCNNHDGCQINDTCVNGACVGTDFNPCVDLIANECVVTECHPTPGGDNFYCTLVLDTTKTLFGTCTPDAACGGRNADGTCSDIISTCLVGQCVQEEICPVDGEPPVILCEGQNRNAVPVGICFGGTNNGDVCVDLVDSTDCIVCDGGTNAGQECTSDETCSDGGGVCSPGTCVAQGTASQPGCLDDNPCTADSCIEGIGCEYEILDDVVCVSDENSCVFGLCDIGECVGAIGNLADGTSCNDNNSCTTGDTCTGGTCGSTSVACTLDEDCTSGHCVGTCSSGTNMGLQCYSDGDCFSSVPFSCNKRPGTCSCNGVNPCQVSSCSATTLGCTIQTNPAGAPCVIDDCLVGTCSGVPFECNSTSQTDSECPSCDGNACAENSCTEAGCISTLIDGALPCTIFIPGSGPNTGNCAGVVSCDGGFEFGVCNGGPNQGASCTSNTDCPSGNVVASAEIECVFPGTCTNAANAGEKCFGDADCSNTLGDCQMDTCLGGTDAGQHCPRVGDCADGGTCIVGCVAIQPLSCTPAGGGGL